MTIAERVFEIRRYGRARLFIAYEHGQPVASARSQRGLRRIIRNRVEGNPPWATL